MNGRGIPGAHGVDHAGYTVPDLDEAVIFFTAVLGAEEVYRVGPYADASGDTMTGYLGVHPRAVAHIALLRLDGLQIELIQLDAPDAVRSPPRPSDAGGRHLAFAVDDIDAAIHYLRRQPSVEVMTSPNRHPDDGSPEGGLASWYFRTTWGMYMEVISR